MGPDGHSVAKQRGRLEAVDPRPRHPQPGDNEWHARPKSQPPDVARGHHVRQCPLGSSGFSCWPCFPGGTLRAAALRGRASLCCQVQRVHGSGTRQLCTHTKAHAKPNGWHRCFYHSSPWFFRLNLELSNSVRLASQQAPRICLPPWHSDYRIAGVFCHP